MKLLVVLVWAAAVASAVNLAACEIRLRKEIDKNTISANNATLFYRNPDDGSFMSRPGNVRLTLPGCKDWCPGGDNLDMYEDVWPRLLTWLIPALLLVGNLHVARVGTVSRFMAVLHLLGDPVDSMWSLLTKAEVWNRFHAIARRHTPRGPHHDAMARGLAVMLSAFEELTGDMGAVHRELDAIIGENGALLSRDDLDHMMLEAAEELVDSRSNEVLRSSLVVVNYLWSVLAALVPVIGGPQSSQPGGRIGTAMFLSWLVTLVLLSNTLSGFVSRRTCLRIMERYCRSVKGRRRDQHVFPNSPLLHARTSWAFAAALPSPVDYIDAQPWNGGLYCFRPCKRLIPAGPRDRSAFQLLALSLAPVVVAFACAFVMIWYTPTTGLGCRGLWTIAAAAVLLFSPGLTWLAHKATTGRLAWYITIIKDTCIGISILVIIVASSIGVFNTCTCWSSVHSRGSQAYVELDPVADREYNAKHIYPAMVATCLGLQVLLFALMYRVMRPGGEVFRPPEDEKMASYRRIHGLDTPEIEMEPRIHRRSTTHDMSELLLPPPVISPAVSPESRPRDFAMTRMPSESEASYGGTPEMPLLGSPVLRRSFVG